MSLEKDKIYVEHILECIEKIDEYTDRDRELFISNELVQDAVLRRLQTMSESTQRLSDDLKKSTIDVDWRALSGFRNVLVHDYLNGIDLLRVWDIVDKYLPALKQAVKDIAGKLQ